jgi:4-amino-4-deoxy-L-arabinose transferase-like glycosyltransferase
MRRLRNVSSGTALPSITHAKLRGNTMTDAAARRETTPPAQLTPSRLSPAARVEAGVALLVLVVLAAGLFFPDLMEGDATQDAVMAMRMHDAGDWVNLIRNGEDYLDKPHLLFWSAMLGYRLFGVHDWSYRLASVLVVVLGAWATYRLARRLHGETAGRIAGLVFVTAQAILLGCHDVRMDALLTGFTAFAIWQLVRWLETDDVRSAVLGGGGLALAVSAKGMVAVAVAGVCLLFFVAGRGLWRRLWSWKVAVGIASFAIVLSPVLVAYYLQFDLHPEKVVNGRTGVSGVRFILFGQSVDRFTGGKGTAAAGEPLFFIHTVAWAFLPWTVFLFAAWLDRASDLLRRGRAAFRDREQLTFLGPLAILVVLSFSRFKLPHYVNVLLPILAVLTAGFIVDASRDARRIGRFRVAQAVIVAAVVALAVVVNGWSFPIQRGWVLASALVLLAVVGLSFRVRDPVQRAWVPSAVAILAANFVLDTNYYPRLGELQPGRHLAARLEAMGAADAYFVQEAYQPVQFYARRLFPVVDLARVERERSDGKRVVLVVGEAGLGRVRAAGLAHEVAYEAPSCPVLKKVYRLLNPRTRARYCRKAYVLEVPPG